MTEFSDVKRQWDGLQDVQPFKSVANVIEFPEHVFSLITDYEKELAAELARAEKAALVALAILIVTFAYRMVR